MSFMSQHYNCCKGGCGDATLANQEAILAAIAAGLTATIDAIDNSGGGGGGTATGTKQDEILAELDRLTGGLRTI